MRLLTVGKNGRLVLDGDALGRGVETLRVKMTQLPSLRLMIAANQKKIALASVALHLVCLCGCGVSDNKAIPDVTGNSLVQVLDAVSGLTKLDDNFERLSIQDCSFEELCSIYEMKKEEGDLASCNYLMFAMSTMIMYSQVAETLGVRPIQIIDFNPIVSDNLIIGERSVEVSYCKSIDDVLAGDDISPDKITTCVLNFEGMMDELAKVVQESQAGRLTLEPDSKLNSMSLSDAYSILGRFLLTTPVITEGAFGKMKMDSVYDPVKGQAFLDYVSKLGGSLLRKVHVVETGKKF